MHCRQQQRVLGEAGARRSRQRCMSRCAGGRDALAGQPGGPTYRGGRPAGRPWGFWRPAWCTCRGSSGSRPPPVALQREPRVACLLPSTCNLQQHIVPLFTNFKGTRRLSQRATASQAGRRAPGAPALPCLQLQLGLVAARHLVKHDASLGDLLELALGAAKVHGAAHGAHASAALHHVERGEGGGGWLEASKGTERRRRHAPAGKAALAGTHAAPRCSAPLRRPAAPPRCRQRTQHSTLPGAPDGETHRAVAGTAEEQEQAGKGDQGEQQVAQQGHVVALLVALRHCGGGGGGWMGGRLSRHHRGCALAPSDDLSR